MLDNLAERDGLEPDAQECGALECDAQGRAAQGHVEAREVLAQDVRAPAVPGHDPPVDRLGRDMAAAEPGRWPQRGAA